MKKGILLLLIGFCCSVSPVLAQDINEITAKGKKAYLEVKVVKGDMPEVYEKTLEHLNGEEWNEWTIVDTPEEGDFTIRLTFEKMGMNIMSARSYGARVRVVAEILDQQGTVLWRSKKYQGNVSEFTGFNALADALRKVVRRALSDELRGKKWKK